MNAIAWMRLLKVTNQSLMLPLLAMTVRFLHGFWSRGRHQVGELAQALSERLHLHSPMAYEAVKTELKSLPPLDDRQHKTPRGAGITLGNHNTRNNHGSMNGQHLALWRLRPGMILKESVHLKDGTLILSSGYALSELSINRLKDLEALLPGDGITVQEAS